MKKEIIFEGVATALITPTNAAGIDYPGMKRLIDWQIAQGVNALVICGTTGESSTLTPEEYHEVVKFSINTVNRRVPVIIGTGSNNTAEAIAKTQLAAALGADAVLCVTPYYNKTTQSGLVKMYEAIADASTKPVIVYNVPSRTGINIEPATYRQLAEHPNINAIKEAGGNLAQIIDTMALVGDRLNVYSGNDDQAYALLALGAKGVISVLSNIAPRQTAMICEYFFAHEYQKSRELQNQLLPLIHALFFEVNPIPVKAALSRMGYCADYLRLPLIPMSNAKREQLYRLMDDYGIKGDQR